MFKIIKKIFSKKNKPKINENEEVLILTEDKTYENEVKKSDVKETRETKSSLTIGV